MADNNSYEINVTLDDFNGIITKNPNGDGTYNVTYTSLTKDQINEIGQQFAKHLSDTDENGNSKAGLHKVALTGNYSQLENKPSASNLQGFHKAAFSGNTSELNNDKGFLTVTTNAYTGSPASTITQNHINEWNGKATINDINTLKGNPTENNNTLEKLENNKTEIVYINPMASPYNYKDFGTISFWDTNSILINDIIDILKENKLVILTTTIGNWLVTNYTEFNDITYISIINLDIDNYSYTLEKTSNTIIKELNESDLEYEERFNNYILTTLPDSFRIGAFIYDSNQACSYFKFFQTSYTYAQVFASTIEHLAQRIEALENQ